MKTGETVSIASILNNGNFDNNWLMWKSFIFQSQLAVFPLLHRYDVPLIKKLKVPLCSMLF